MTQKDGNQNLRETKREIRFPSALLISFRKLSKLFVSVLQVQEHWHWAMSIERKIHSGTRTKQNF